MDAKKNRGLALCSLQFEEIAVTPSNTLFETLICVLIMFCEFIKMSHGRLLIVKFFLLCNINLANPILLSIIRSSNQCRIMGNWSCCSSYSSCTRWRYSPIWSGCFWKHVPWRTYVCPNQGLSSLAQACQCEPKTLCNHLCYCCYWSTSIGHG